VTANTRCVVEKIRIALGNNGAGTAPVFAAVEGGYFHEQGLEPELIAHQGHSRSLAALIAGEADFTNAVGPEVIMANQRQGATR
jgi:ABC-type nitrate/sulfonate/bicarbonate transport system substrate-binding protein